MSKPLSREDIVELAYQKINSKISDKIGNPNPDSCYRYSFSDKSEMETFQQYMEDNGVTTYSSDRKFEGAYVIDVPKNISRDSIKDENYLRDENHRSAGESVDSASLVQHYSYENNTNVYGFSPKEREAANTTSYQDDYMSRQNSVVASTLLNNLEGIKEVYSAYVSVKNAADTVKQISKSVEENEKEKQTLTEQNNEIFDNGFVENRNYQSEAVVKVIGIKADGTPEYGVMVNGQRIAEGTDAYNDIMAMYEGRKNQAEDILSQQGITTKFNIEKGVTEYEHNGSTSESVSVFNSDERVKNAANIMDNSYDQKFVLDGQKSWTDTTEASLLAQSLTLESMISNESTYREFNFSSDGRNGFTGDDVSLVSALEKSGALSQNGSSVLADGLKSGDTFSMSITEREEALSDLRAASNSLFTMNNDEMTDVSSFLSNSDSGLGLMSYAISHDSDVEWKRVSSSLKRYTNGLSVEDRKAVDTFLKNRQELQKIDQEVKTITAELKSRVIDNNQEKALEKRRAELLDKGKKLNGQVDEKKIKSILEDAISKSSVNAKTKEQLDGIIKKLDFSKLENSLRESNLNLLNDFKNMDKKLAAMLGLNPLDFSKGATPQKLAEFNKRFVEAAAKLHLPVFTLKGKLDVNALKSLSPLDKEKLGLTSKMTDALVLINGKNAFNKPADYKNVLASKLNKLRSKINYASSRLFNKVFGQDEDVGQLINNVYKIKQVVTGQHIKQVSAKINKIRKFFNPNATRKTETLAKNLSNKVGNKLRNTKTFQKKAAQKATKNAGKKAAKVSKNVKRTRRAVKKATQKATVSAAKMAAAQAGAAGAAGAGGAAGGAAAGAGGSSVGVVAAGVVAVIIGAAIIIIIALVIIQSFLNRDPILEKAAPRTPADTVAFDLYTQLKEQETAWTSGLRNFDEIWKAREDLYYTEEFLTFEQYSNKVDAFKLNLEYDIDSKEVSKDGKVFVNPFYKLPFTNTDDYLDVDYRTEVDSFDGANKATIGTNDNVFSRTSAEDAGGYHVGLNTGHTSNIKDILAMTDVMYSMEMDTSYDSDGGLGEGDGGIMGCSPAQLNWQHFKDAHAGWLRIQWQKIVTWVKEKLGVEDDTENPLDKYNYKELKYGAVSYETITNYAFTLFHASHQEHLYLDVQFFGDNVKKGLEIGGKTVKQEEASKFGYCVNPTHKKFFIVKKKDSSGVAAGIAGKATADGSFVEGNGYFPIDSGYEVNLSIYKNLQNRTDLDPDVNTYSDVDDTLAEPCIRTSDGSTKSTWDFISPQLTENGGYGCWYQDGDPEKGEYTSFSPCFVQWDFKYDGYYFGNIRSERGYAEWDMPNADKAKEFLGNELLYGSEFWFTAGGVHPLTTSNKNSQSYTIYNESIEKLAETSLTNGGYTKQTDADGHKFWYKYDLNNDKNTFTIYKVETLWDALEAEGISRTDGANIIQSMENNTYIKNGGWMVDNDYYDWSEGAHHMCRTIDYTKMTTTTYKRSCKGHTFVYCGGHIAVHNHGSVYSATNDQLAIAGVVDEDINPAADEYDVYEKFGGELKGKYDDNNFPSRAAIEAEWDLSDDLGKMKAVNVLAQSGKGPSVWADVYQGSYVGRQGLNLYSEGDEWLEGIDLSAFVTPAQHLSDFRKSDGTWDEDKWDSQTLNEDTHPSAISHYWRDVFDVDCTIKYGKNVFPLFADPSNYKGWNTDNMQLALNRMSVEWTDVYGFDIPWELGDWYEPATKVVYEKGEAVTVTYEDENGHLKKQNGGARGYTLSEDDIDAIVDGVKSHYYLGGSVTEEREESIRTVLRWVGRGYEEGRGVEGTFPHTSSVFNKDAVNTKSNEAKWLDSSNEETAGTKTITFEGSSTMGSSGTAFVDYIRYLNGESYMDGNAKWNTSTPTISAASLVPGDYIVHYPNGADLKNVLFENKDSFNNAIADIDAESTFKLKNALTIADYYAEKTACIYIGTLNEDIVLSTGQKLNAGVKLIVDMNAQQDNLDDGTHVDNKGHNYIEGQSGVISLHGTPASDFWTWDYKTTYWWLQNDSGHADSLTKCYSFKHYD